jgi:rfaE bifunctional protein kinase chain/domain
VLILQHEQTETIPGGAANCALNLAALGAGVSLVSAIGKDDAGQALLERLTVAQVNCQGLISSEQLQTITKVRVLAGQLHSTRQQVIRIDYETAPLNNKLITQSLINQVDEQTSSADAIIISDYNYGVANHETAGAVREAANARGLPVLVDSRFRLSNYTGFTSATPNEEEVETILGKVIADADLDSAGAEMRERLDYRALLVTRGGRGMILFEQGVAPLHIDAVGAREPVDVTGAGDTVIATYTLALASDASFPDAARLANYAGGLVVTKRGTATVTADELEHSVLFSELN